MKILEGITLTKPELARKTRESSHWVKLASTLYKCEDQKELLTMLYVELNGLKRYYVVHRIYARFNAVRARAEKKELTKLAKVYGLTGDLSGKRKDDGEVLKEAS